MKPESRSYFCLSVQISHLNGKIVEDNEELIQAKQYTDSVRVNMQKEVDIILYFIKSFITLTIFN